MCGRYAVFEGEDMNLVREIMAEVLERLSGSPLFSQWKPGEVFPTGVAPVLLGSDGGAEAGLMKWGFPSYKGSAVIINARRETLREKPMFKGPVAQGRCIIPASVFYEWKAEEGAKRKAKYEISPVGTPLLMAGLHGTFRSALGHPYDAYTIVTTAANGSIADIHDRMPLMLDSDGARAWLAPGTNPEVIDSLPPLTEVLIRKCG